MLAGGDLAVMGDKQEDAGSSKETNRLHFPFWADSKII
jgi:hypothetical protein